MPCAIASAIRTARRAMSSPDPVLIVKPGLTLPTESTLCAATIRKKRAGARSS
jgi:hypothetical protein